MKVATYIFLTLAILGIFTGCAKKEQLPASWVSVTKPPIQVIYVDRSHEISPKTVYGIMKMTQAYPYEPYQFNSTTGIAVTASKHKSDHNSDSKDTSINVSGGLRP